MSREIAYVLFIGTTTAFGKSVKTTSFITGIQIEYKTDYDTCIVHQLHDSKTVSQNIYHKQQRLLTYTLLPTRKISSRCCWGKPVNIKAVMNSHDNDSIVANWWLIDTFWFNKELKMCNFIECFRIEVRECHLLMWKFYVFEYARINIYDVSVWLAGRCWSNNRVTGDLRRHDAHVTQPY